MLNLLLMANLLVSAGPKTSFIIKGIPLLSYSSQTGVGYGLRIGLYTYEPGEKEYKWNIYGQFFKTTGGVQKHRIFFDYKSPLRVTLTAEYNKALYENYYPDSIAFDVPMGDTFYTYIHTNMFFRGVARYGIGFIMLESQNHSIEMRSNSALDSVRPYGIEGGRINGLQGGIFFDRRDYEGDPTEGYVFELSYGLWFGKDYRFTTLFASARGYISFLKDRITLASRIAYSVLPQKDVPFFAYGWNYSIQPFEGLGGRNSVRGYPTFYHMSSNKFVVNNELRFRMLSFNFLNSEWTVGSVVGIDAGMSKYGKNITGFVGGLRVMWGRDFIIALDYGKSGEFSTLDITFDHAF